MEKKYVLVIDEGTTGVRAFLYNKEMKIVGVSYQKIEALFPGPGEAEEDALEIYKKTVEVCRDVVKEHGISAEEIACVGIANQRLSWLFWNKETGKPLRNAVLWLDSRGRFQKQKFMDDPVFNEKFPGVAPYLPGLFMPLILDKIKDEDPAFAAEFEKPTTIFGNIDTWLIWNLTGGQVHATSPSTASNSTVFVSGTNVWNTPFLEYVGVRMNMMPQVKDEADDYGMMSADILGVGIPICSAIADQQSALFSQGCIEPNTLKCTIGTGTFVDINMGTELKRAGALNPSVGWRLNGVTNYMLEGSSFTAGACLEWARHELKLFDDFESMNDMAEQISDSGGVYFIPALTGLSGIPFNDETAKGAYMGITPKATRNHFVRATLEGIGFATVCLMEEAMKAGIEIKQIKLSGGVSQSDTIGQLISNLTGAEVIRPKSVEATALGAAEMAAIKIGWVTPEDTARFIEVDHVFTPDQNQAKTKKEFANWKNAVSRTLNWLS